MRRPAIFFDCAEVRGGYRECGVSSWMVMVRLYSECESWTAVKNRYIPAVSLARNIIRLAMARHGAQNSPVRLELLKNHYYLMRHGQSEANVQGIIVSDPEIGVEGFGLTDTGRAQAHESIRSAGISPLRIISSDFKRARQTAEIASQLTGAELMLDARLRERFFGSYNGQSDEHYARVWEKDAENLAPGMNVELPDSVLSRALDVITECEAAVQGTVLLVAHGDVCQILLAWAAGRTASEHRSLPHMQTAEIRRLNP